jgi:DNA polymerase I-like protein with 3'-5' exonuclease and polymerase domains
LKELLIIKCDPEDALPDHVEAVNAYFLEEQKPMKLSPHERDNVLITSEMQFAEILAMMEDNGVTNAKGLSEFDFYNRLKFLEKKFKRTS